MTPHRIELSAFGIPIDGIARDEPIDDRCSRCLRRVSAPYYQDGIGENAVFNGQPLCDDCVWSIESTVRDV